MLAGPKLWGMKTLIALLVLTCTVSAVAQTNQPKLTPEQQRDAAKLQTLIETELLRKASEEAFAKAQQAAIEREARMITSALPVLVKPEVPIAPVLPVYVNTNDMSSNIGTFIELLDKHYPGIATNFTAEQRAMKSTRPIIRATVDKDGKIIFLSTNAPGTPIKELK